MVQWAIKCSPNAVLWMTICCAGTLPIAVSAQNRLPVTSQRRTAAASKPRIDYSRFSHNTAQHRVACKSCHTFPSKNWKQVRKTDDAFPDVTEYPAHEACLGCHRQ